MNVLDIGIILVLLIFAVVGFKQGVIRELFALVGIVLIFYLSFFLSGIAGDILCKTLPFIEFKGSIAGISAINLLLYQVLAFILIFGILLSLYEVILKVSKALQKIVNLTIILWLPSKLLGALVGIIKGYIILFLILLALLIPFGKNDLYESSRFANTIIYKTPVLSSSIGSITKSTKEIFALANNLVRDDIIANEANLQTIDILLEHNIVDKATILELIKRNKLTDIDGYETILNKY